MKTCCCSKTCSVRPVDAKPIGQRGAAFACDLHRPASRHPFHPIGVNARLTAFASISPTKRPRYAAINVTIDEDVILRGSYPDARCEMIRRRSNSYLSGSGRSTMIGLANSGRSRRLAAK
jgi:hypothetical protein